MMGDVGGVEGGSRLAVGMVKKVEMGWWSFFYSNRSISTFAKIAGYYAVRRPKAHNPNPLIKKRTKFGGEITICMLAHELVSKKY